ncbi:MAG: hypothetical protein RLZZ385_977 [Pseudomonadota bacterium]|jgi:uncharacterized protein (DUF1501 family)
MKTMKRREFFRLMGAAGLTTLAPWPLAANAAQPYTGPFYISVAAIGGWDVTSFCDPKANPGGEPLINNWATSEAIGKVGNLSFAPVGNNQAFFERFYRDMLVINGLDTQTNSHDDGVRHTWSGRVGVGYPSFGAIASAAIAPDLPLSLVHANGYSETAGIARYSRLQSPEVIRNLVNDDTVYAGSQSFTLFESGELDLIQQAQAARMQRLLADTSLLPRQRGNLNSLFLANSTRGDLDAFAKLLPETFETDSDLRSAQLALLAYQSGLCVSCQLGVGGFDTHQNHDETHFTRLAKLTDLVTYLFDTAEAAGFGDRLVVALSSDFGRKPFYNAGGGKDHWPIGSAIIMKKNATWGNRVVGATDAKHNALKINPQTLLVDNGSAGIALEPKHLQQALRQLGGIDSSPVAQAFPLNAEAVDFFNPALGTA